MICNDCIDKPLVRGIKRVECHICEDMVSVNSMFSNICKECSNNFHICERCGEDVSNDCHIRCNRPKCAYQLTIDEIVEKVYDKIKDRM